MRHDPCLRVTLRPHRRGHAPEYEQPRAGNANRRSGDLRRDPSDTSTASPAEHRIKLHGQGAMRDRPNEASTTASPSLIPIRRCSHQDQERPPPRTSHTNSNRDSTIKQGPSLHQTHWFTQIQLAGGSPTTWSAHTRSPTISHDLPRHGRPIDRQLTAPQPSWP